MRVCGALVLLLSLTLVGCWAAPAPAPAPAPVYGAGTGTGYGTGYGNGNGNGYVGPLAAGSNAGFAVGAQQLLTNQRLTYPLNVNGLRTFSPYGYGGYAGAYGAYGGYGGNGFSAYYEGLEAYPQQAQVQLQQQQQPINIPAKQHLPAQILDYGTEREPSLETMDSAAPVMSIPITQLPTTTLAMTVGPTLAPATLPTTVTSTQTVLPERVETPVKAQVLPPQYREQVIEQRIISPVLKTRPLLQQHIIDEQLIQPIKQHTTQIQPVITTPILRTVLTQQPVKQDQIQTQTIVRRHVVEQPRVVHHTVNEYQTGAQQMEQVQGETLPTLTRGDDAITAILQQDATPTKK